MNILEHAKKILYERGEEKNRQYGDFDESMELTAKLASEMAGYDVSLKTCYFVYIAGKFAREAHSHKYDNLLDAIVYTAQMNDHLDRFEKAKQIKNDIQNKKGGY